MDRVPSRIRVLARRTDGCCVFVTLPWSPLQPLTLLPKPRVSWLFRGRHSLHFAAHKFAAGCCQYHKSRRLNYIMLGVKCLRQRHITFQRHWGAGRPRSRHHFWKRHTLSRHFTLSLRTTRTIRNQDTHILHFVDLTYHSGRRRAPTRSGRAARGAGGSLAAANGCVLRAQCHGKFGSEMKQKRRELIGYGMHPPEHSVTCTKARETKLVFR